MRRLLFAFVLLFSVAASAQSSIQAPAGGITTPTVVGKATVANDAACAAFQYWIRPVAGALNTWRVCNNGIVSNIGSGGGGGIFQTTNLAGLPAPGTGTEGLPYNLTDGFRGPYWYKNGYAVPFTPEIDLYNFGASGDAGWYSSVSCTNGSGIFSYTLGQPGRAARAGDHFKAVGCGAAGADLFCNVSSATTTQITCGGGVTASVSLATSAYWGTSVDDSAALQAAVNYCQTIAPGGCTIKVRSGTFFVGNVTFPAASGTQNGNITLSGSGKGATNFVMTGPAQSCTLKAPANSVPTTTQGISFLGPRALTATDPIAMCWYGGTFHHFQDNAMNSGYIMVSAANTWINTVERNVCTAATYCIEHGGSAGTGPVNATQIRDNEFTGFNVYGIYTHTNQASWGNYYGPNSFEDDSTPYTSVISIADNSSVFEEGYTEVQAPGSGYYLENHGNTNTFNLRSAGCMFNQQSARISTDGANGSWPCAGHSYFIVQTGGAGGSVFTGIGPADVDLVRAGDRFIGGRIASGGASDLLGNNNGQLGALMVYPGGQSSTVWDWTFGRVDIATVPYGFSDATTNNPSLPNSFGTSALIPLNGRIANKFPSIGFPWGFAFHICVNNPSGCTANPITASQWAHFGDIYTRVHTEGTATPGSQPWVPGDLFWNKTPSNATLNNPCWYNVVGGTPGTWWNCLGANKATSVVTLQVALTPGSVAANTCATQLFTGGSGILGTNDVMIAVSHPTNQPGLIISPGQYVPTTQFNWNVCNVTAGALTPTAETYTVVFLRML